MVGSIGYQTSAVQNCEDELMCYIERYIVCRDYEKCVIVSVKTLSMFQTDAAAPFWLPGTRRQTTWQLIIYTRLQSYLRRQKLIYNIINN